MTPQPVMTGEHAATLLAVASLALTFTGFSTVAVLFQHRDFTRWPVRIVLRLRTMMYVSLTAVLFALVPLGLFYLDITGTTLWATSSGLLAVFGTLLYGEIVARSKPWIRSRSLGIGFTVATGVVVVALVVVLGLNAVGALWAPRFGVYLLGLFWLLVVAGLMFVRLVTFPAIDDEAGLEPDEPGPNETPVKRSGRPRATRG